MELSTYIYLKSPVGGPAYEPGPIRSHTKVDLDLIIPYKNTYKQTKIPIFAQIK